MDSITSLEFSVDGKSILTSFGLTILIGIIALSHIGGIENATSASIEVRMRWSDEG